jgi:DNA-binding response OmpR family regulator
LQSELNELEDVATHAQGRPPELRDFSGRFLRKGRLILDLQAKRATFGEDVLNLPPATFDYLRILAQHSPDVVEYQKLVVESQAYHVGPVEARELAKWHIHVIRNALKNNLRSKENLLTVRGTGYSLILD